MPKLYGIFTLYTIRNINIRDYSQAQVEAWAPERLNSSVWENG